MNIQVYSTSIFLYFVQKTHAVKAMITKAQVEIVHTRYILQLIDIPI